MSGEQYSCALRHESMREWFQKVAAQQADGLNALLKAVSDMRSENQQNTRRLDDLTTRLVARKVIDRDARVVRFVMPDGEIRAEAPLDDEWEAVLNLADEAKAYSDRVAARFASFREEVGDILGDRLGVDSDVAAENSSDLDENTTESLYQLVLVGQDDPDLGVAHDDLGVSSSISLEGAIDGTQRVARSHHDSCGVDGVHEDVSSTRAGSDAGTSDAPASTVAEQDGVGEAPPQASPTHDPDTDGAAA